MRTCAQRTSRLPGHTNRTLAPNRIFAKKVLILGTHFAAPIMNGHVLRLLKGKPRWTKNEENWHGAKALGCKFFSAPLLGKCLLTLSYSWRTGLCSPFRQGRSQITNDR